MSRSRRIIGGLLLLAALAVPSRGPRAQTDDGIIRLRPAAADPVASPETPGATSESAVIRDTLTGPRRGFDYHGFEGRLESLWFQRKTLLADGRYDDALAQSEQIRAFCAEEGVRRLEHLSAALVAEAGRYAEEGQFRRALDSLAFAEALDPGRPQVQVARTVILWRSGQGLAATAAQGGRALAAAVRRSVLELTLFNLLALVVVVAAAGSVLVYALLMAVRYQVPFRHEVEEWTTRVLGDRWARAAGWTLLLLPLILWVGAGWLALYWTLILFRFMQRGERLVAVAALLCAALLLPAYGLAVNAYGLTADPVVRTTLASAGGQYDPDRILRLRQLVQAHPDDPVYRFLLAGLYKNGRYFEDAFAEYREALEVDPTLDPAHVNIGNIFFATGQFAEAIASYNDALAINPRSTLAHFNLYLAQSESFRFREAEETLEQARLIDAAALTRLIAETSVEGERRSAIDASLGMESVWQAALAGAREAWSDGPPARSATRAAGISEQALNPVTVVALLTLLGCGATLVLGRAAQAARRCVRCGRPFCHHCKSAREGHEYCSQCLHLFVLGDGLAHETKTRKLYEVERHERRARAARKLASTLLPGSAQILRGRPLRGLLLVGIWLTALLAFRPDLMPLQRVLGMDPGIGLLGSTSVPAVYDLRPLALCAAGTMVLAWVAGNAWRVRRRER